jgi:Family of unknown function (DUF6599)
MLPVEPGEHQSQCRVLTLTTEVLLHLKSLPKLLATALMIAVSAGLISAQTGSDAPSQELFRLLPSKIGSFYQATPPRPLHSLALEGLISPDVIRTGFLGGEAEYVSSKGERLLVELVQLHSDSEAYSLLTQVAKSMRETTPAEHPSLESAVGTAGIQTRGQAAFFKGSTFVRVSFPDQQKASSAPSELARFFADQLNKGEAEVPVLVKHLPDWQVGQKHAVYLSNFKTLNSISQTQSVLDAVRAEGDADAVFADYGSTKVLLVEFHTPQLAAENDQRIIARIHELWTLGQPAPTAYRRVGNYSVFVFDAPDEQTAKQLIDQVKYEQVVQWLGENPYILKEAQKRYVDTTLGVLIAVIKASGLAIVGCLGIGGLLGALLFSRRRAQQKSVEAFSDAGGMLRLNLDELSPQTDPARLLRERN